MSNETDELAQPIHSRICEDSLDDCLEWRGKCVKAAEEVLAAGYRKPRTITTVDELDEAIESAFEDAAHMVLADSKGRPWIIWSDEDGDEVVNSWPQDGDPKRLKLGNIALPATVLSHPAVQ